MIQPAEQRKRSRKRKAAVKAKIKKANPQAEWAEAFMVLLLGKAGGSISMSMDTLAAYSELKGGQPTKLTYDGETGMVTLSLNVKTSDKLIVVPKKPKIITN